MSRRRKPIKLSRSDEVPEIGYITAEEVHQEQLRLQGIRSAWPKPVVIRMIVLSRLQMTANTKSESWICMFMDAMPFNLEFEINDLRIIDMLPRHCGFEVSMTEAAERMLGITPPYDFEVINPKIDALIERLRNKEEIECDQTFPAATVGVLWSWQLVTKHKWTWCAVNQNWWETIGVCDPSKRCVILPVQYFRRVAGETGEIGATDERSIDKWPSDILAEVDKGQLPVKPNQAITFFY